MAAKSKACIVTARSAIMGYLNSKPRRKPQLVALSVSETTAKITASTDNGEQKGTIPRRHQIPTLNIDVKKNSE